ncbi:unnamed protein product, partial [Musa acuminata subsp. malaccensis]
RKYLNYRILYFYFRNNRDIEKWTDIKYLNYRILYFYFRNNRDIENWIDMYTDIEINKNTKTYQKKILIGWE